MDDVISKLPSLKRLNISAAPNAKFGPGYTAMKNLEYLHIRGNISEINNETFASLKYTRSLNMRFEYYTPKCIEFFSKHNITRRKFDRVTLFTTHMAKFYSSYMQ